MKAFKTLIVIFGLFWSVLSTSAQSLVGAIQIVEQLEASEDFESAKLILDDLVVGANGMKKVVHFAALSSQMPRHSIEAIFDKLGFSSDHINEIFDYSEEKVGKRRSSAFFDLSLMTGAVVFVTAVATGTIVSALDYAINNESFLSSLKTGALIGGQIALVNGLVFFALFGVHMFLFQPEKRAYMKEFAEMFKMNHRDLPQYDCLRGLVSLASRSE